MRALILTSIFVIACSDGAPVESDDASTEMSCNDVERPEGWTTESHCKGVEPNYDKLFDDTKVDRIDIVVTRSNYDLTMDDLENHGHGPGGGGPGGGGPGGPGGPGGEDQDPIWVPVTISYDELTWNYVGMRYKGNSSLGFAMQRGLKKIGFRLTFDKYEEEHPETNDQRFYGFKKMTFSNGFLDNSLIRDKLAADVFRAAGLPAARGAFVRVYLDYGDGPIYMGLYTMIEDPSNKLIDTQFKDGTGNLYKPDGDGARLSSFRQDDMDKKTNEETNDFSDVEAMIAALNGPKTNGDSWRQNLESTFDVQGFIKYLALNQAMMNWDTYGWMTHNYYLYQDVANDGKLTWIPWDLNEAFMNRGDSSARSLSLDEISSSWPLIRNILDDEVYRSQYLETLSNLIENEFTLEFVKSKMEAYHALIAPYVVGENGEQAPYSLLDNQQAFENALTSNREGLIPHLEWRISEIQNIISQ